MARYLETLIRSKIGQDQIQGGRGFDYKDWSPNNFRGIYILSNWLLIERFVHPEGRPFLTAPIDIRKATEDNLAHSDKRIRGVKVGIIDPVRDVLFDTKEFRNLEEIIIAEPWVRVQDSQGRVLGHDLYPQLDQLPGKYAGKRFRLLSFVQEMGASGAPGGAPTPAGINSIILEELQKERSKDKISTFNDVLGRVLVSAGGQLTTFKAIEGDAKDNWYTKCHLTPITYPLDVKGGPLEKTLKRIEKKVVKVTGGPAGGREGTGASSKEAKSDHELKMAIDMQHTAQLDPLLDMAKYTQEFNQASSNPKPLNDLFYYFKDLSTGEEFDFEKGTYKYLPLIKLLYKKGSNVQNLDKGYLFKDKAFVISLYERMVSCLKVAIWNEKKVYNFAQLPDEEKARILDSVPMSEDEWEVKFAQENPWIKKIPTGKDLILSESLTLYKVKEYFQSNNGAEHINPKDFEVEAKLLEADEKNPLIQALEEWYEYVRTTTEEETNPANGSIPFKMMDMSQENYFLPLNKLEEFPASRPHTKLLEMAFRPTRNRSDIRHYSYGYFAPRILGNIVAHLIELEQVHKLPELASVPMDRRRYEVDKVLSQINRVNKGMVEVTMEKRPWLKVFPPSFKDLLRSLVIMDELLSRAEVDSLKGTEAGSADTEPVMVAPVEVPTGSTPSEPEPEIPQFRGTYGYFRKLSKLHDRLSKSGKELMQSLLFNPDSPVDGLKRDMWRLGCDNSEIAFAQQLGYVYEEDSFILDESRQVTIDRITSPYKMLELLRPMLSDNEQESVQTFDDFLKKMW